MSVRKEVGNITAYAAAVLGGYTGTYEQFCRDMAKFTDEAEAVLEAAGGARASAEAAAKSAEEAAASVSAGKYVSLYIGDDGHLYLVRTENAQDIDFTLENGRLVMEVEV